MSPTPVRPSPAKPQPLSEDELLELDQLLASVPAPLEPLDVTMLDGFLCAVLLQPVRVPSSQWLPRITDVDARPLPASFDPSALARVRHLAERRHRELDEAIEGRQWFDPWIFELDDDASPSETVYPWVAGFATALDVFESLTAMPEQALLEPLAAIYMHLDPDDLEDAEDLLAEIETLEPPQDLEEAVEGLVSSTLLLADVSRPPVARRGPGNAPRGPSRRGPRRPMQRR